MAKAGQSDTKKAILEALETYHGIVTDAVNKVGIARSTFYEWLNADPVFKTQVEDIQEHATDFVESKLFEKIRGVRIGKLNEEGELSVYDVPPSDQAITFYLRTKGKKRGYAERTEVTGANGQAIITETHVKIIRDKATGIAPGDFTPKSTGGIGSEEKV